MNVSVVIVADVALAVAVITNHANVVVINVLKVSTACKLFLFAVLVDYANDKICYRSNILHS